MLKRVSSIKTRRFVARRLRSSHILTTKNTACRSQSTTSPSSKSEAIITRTLYRSLLRTAKPFASSRNGPVLCSLLHRNGLDDYEYLEQHQHQTLQQLNKEKEEEDDDDDDDDDDSTHYLKSFNENISSSSLSSSPTSAPQPHVDLYKQLLRHLFYDESNHILRHMQFPYQIIQSNHVEDSNDDDDDDNNTNNNDEHNNRQCIMGKRLVDIIKREFRTNSKHDNVSTNNNTANKDDTNTCTDTFGQPYTNATKRETAFLVLRQLQTKLSWAEEMGIPNLFQNQYNHERSSNNTDDVSGAGNDTIAAAAAKYVHTLPTKPSTTSSSPSSSVSYLQSGAFLIAHPMLGGIFSKSIICILQHTHSTPTNNNEGVVVETKGEGGEDNERAEEEVEKKGEATKSLPPSVSNYNHNGSGGTYGLVINHPLETYLSDDEDDDNFNYTTNHHNSKKNRTLRQVMRHDSLPHGVKVAFGDCPVRNGGPINLSIQMLRRSSSDVEDRLKIGGFVLPTLSVDDGDDNGSDGSSDVSTAMFSDEAIYFGGDIIKAAQAVIDGDMDRDDFTFIVGASCWEDGQLESEVARGYWLPCSGPSEIAFSGQCQNENNRDGGEEGSTDDDEHSKLDLWHSMMCAQREDEGRLANMISSEESSMSEYGDACDELT